MDIDLVEAIYIEGTAQYKDLAQAINDRALQQAVELAKKF